MSSDVLPHLPGKRYLIVQGKCPGGPTYAPTSVFKYGYDFGMEIGTSSYARRGHQRRRAQHLSQRLTPGELRVGASRRPDDCPLLAPDSRPCKCGPRPERRAWRSDWLERHHRPGPGFSGEPALRRSGVRSEQVSDAPINRRNTTPNPRGLQVGLTYMAQ